jgi:hypothetical protein
MSIDKNLAERVVARIQHIWSLIAGFFSFMNDGPLGWIGRRLRSIWNWYHRAVWNRFARNDEGRLTPKRATVTFFATLFGLYMIPTLLGFTLQVGMMAATMKTEEVYLTQSEEIDPNGELFNVRGNTSAVSTPDNALYYRVRPTLAHQIYSYAKYHTPFYAEDIASIAPGLNRCEVTSYGVRVRFLVRGWGLYPDMLWSSCTPVEAPSSEG